MAALFLLPVIGGEFMTSSDRGYFYVQFDAPADASIDYTRRKVAEADAAAATHPLPLIYRLSDDRFGQFVGEFTQRDPVWHVRIVKQ